MATQQCPLSQCPASETSGYGTPQARPYFNGEHVAERSSGPIFLCNMWSLY